MHEYYFANYRLLTDDGIDRIIGAVRRRRTYIQLLFKGEA